jgi:hypothetical protein
MMGCECGRERPCQCGREPGPGQDVEAQARPVEQLAKLLQEAGAELVISLTASEWREVLRAAQAEAERRAQEAEARLAEREKE